MKENVFSKLGVNVHIGLDIEGQDANKIADVEALSPTEVIKIETIYSSVLSDNCTVLQKLFWIQQYREFPEYRFL